MAASLERTRAASVLGRVPHRVRSAAVRARSTVPQQTVALSGSWRTDGAGTLRATVSRVFLDTFSKEQPARCGGVIDGVVTFTGTRSRPDVSAQFTVSEGAFASCPYDKLTARIDYQGGAMAVDLRLDQAPGIWLTVAGRAPLDLLSKDAEQPMDLAVKSSPIALGLIEGAHRRWSTTSPARCCSISM